MTRQIPLTKGQVALVDDWRYEELMQGKWHALWSETTRSYYAVRREGQRSVRMHRHIMNTPAELECDHINHNTLDNQEHNLRNVTRSQNQLNTTVRSHSRLQEKCIYKRPRGGYRVQIRRDKRIVFDRSFKTLAAAVAARNEALRQYHGAYVYHGNP